MGKNTLRGGRMVSVRGCNRKTYLIPTLCETEQSIQSNAKSQLYTDILYITQKVLLVMVPPQAAQAEAESEAISSPELFPFAHD